MPGRAVWFAVLFAVIYYLAGATALVFASITCLVEALLHRKIRLAIAQAVLAVSGAFLLGWLVFDLDLQAIYTAGTPWEPDKGLKLSPLASWFAFVLHAFVPCLVLVALLGQVLMEAEARMKSRRVRRRRVPRPVTEAWQTRWRTADPGLRTG